MASGFLLIPAVLVLFKILVQMWWFFAILSLSSATRSLDYTWYNVMIYDVDQLGSTLCTLYWSTMHWRIFSGANLGRAPPSKTKICLLPIDFYRMHARSLVKRWFMFVRWSKLRAQSFLHLPMWPVTSSILLFSISFYPTLSYPYFIISFYISVATSSHEVSLIC
jgi:hypothetical protein